ncbi:MAG: hypothetical protein ACTS6G_04930, partial [Candidatus Hodgkinia cicadicola]
TRRGERNHWRSFVMKLLPSAPKCRSKYAEAEQRPSDYYDRLVERDNVVPTVFYCSNYLSRSWTEPYTFDRLKQTKEANETANPSWEATSEGLLK